MFCPQDRPYCNHFTYVFGSYCSGIGIYEVRGPPLYSGLGDCPNYLILSFPSPKRCPPVYTDTEAASFSQVPKR